MRAPKSHTYTTTTKSYKISFTESIGRAYKDLELAVQRNEATPEFRAKFQVKLQKLIYGNFNLGTYAYEKGTP